MFSSFGAVMEEFEVEDAITSLFAGKDSLAMSTSMATTQRAIMA